MAAALREVMWFELLTLAFSTSRQSETIAPGHGFLADGRHAERLL